MIQYSCEVGGQATPKIRMMMVIIITIIVFVIACIKKNVARPAGCDSAVEC